MANTYYDSELSSEQIDRALKAISDIVSASNNGKVLCITDGRIDARSASTWSGDVVLQPGSATANGDYNPPAGVDGFSSFHVEVSGGGGAVVQPLVATENRVYNTPPGVDGFSPVTVNVSGSGGVVRVDHNIYTYNPGVTAGGAMSAGFAFTVSKSLIISKIRVYAKATVVSAHIMDGDTYLASINDATVVANQWNDLALSDMVTLVPGKTYVCWYSHKTAHPAAVASVASPYVPFITYLYSVYAATADTVPDRSESGTMMGADLFLYGIVADE